MGKVKIIYFSKTVAAIDLKIGRCIELNSKTILSIDLKVGRCIN